MIPYKLYLDLSGGKNPDGYFEVSVISVAPFTEQSIDDMVTTRKQWGDVQLKNEPFKGVMLYDQITALKPTQEIHLKFISAYEMIIGYFGTVDCKLNDDQKVLNINVTTLDQYTEFLENRDEEVKLFDEGNVIVNGDFGSFFELKPIGWDTHNSNFKTIQSYFLNTTTVKIPAGDFLSLNMTDGYMFQNIPDVLANKRLSFSFLWALTGEPAIGEPLIKESLYFNVVLKGDTDWYNITPEGKWIAYNSNYQASYTKNSVNPIPEGMVQNFNKFSITSEYIPVGGIITVYFYHKSNFIFPETNLRITDVILNTTSIALKTITLEFDSDDLITREQQDDQITYTNKRKGESYFKIRSLNWDTAEFDCNDFFDLEGKPNSNTLGLRCDSNLSIQDILNTYKDTSQYFNPSHKFELSEITIYRGQFEPAGVFGKKHRWFYGVAKFSREEIYKIDDPDENGLPIPPEINSGWARTGIPETPNSKNILWVRHPFNGIDIPWIKQPINLSPNTSHPNGFVFHASILSKKQYPINSESTIQINNAIDFRELIKQVYQQTHISLRGKQVYSNFLWNDALSVDETTAVYGLNNTGYNYVSMTDDSSDIEVKNKLNNIAAIHTFEFTDIPSSDEDKSILKTSAKKLMDDLFDVYLPQCFWFIDLNGDLHIEHLKYFDRVNTAKSLLTEKHAYLKNYSSWEYAKDKLYSKEEYTTPNSGYLDFNKSIVTFDKITSNKRGEDIKGSYSASIITTDVQYCAENPNNIQNGIVLVAYETKDGINKAKYSRGQYSGKMAINGDLSISSLLEDYATYEGTWNQGLINGKSQVFKFSKRSRQGIEISIKGIFLDKVILSKLGIGVIKSRTIDYKNENTKLTALYRYSDDYLVIAPNVLMGFGDTLPTTNEVATITTDSTVTDITETSAMCTGIVSSDGGSPITERGICYGATIGSLTVDNAKVISSSETATFTVLVDGLDSATLYWIRAYAINGVGVSYGSAYKFSTN